MLCKFGQLDDILDEHPSHLFPRLPTDTAHTFKTLAFDSMALLTAVATYYMVTEPRSLFNTTIKCHMMLHSAANAHKINPRLSICYSGEDYMRHMKRVVASSIRGTSAAAVSGKMCAKIGAAMHMEMTPRALL